MSEIQLSEPPNIPESAWKLVSRNEFMDVWEAEVELPSGHKGIVRRKTYTEAPLLLKVNEELRKESAGRRYTSGMGSDKGGNLPLVQTASIPLPIYYRDIAPRQRAGDKDHLRWWLRQDENAQWRTTEGKSRD
jgi:hypothetical protein